MHYAAVFRRQKNTCIWYPSLHTDLCLLQPSHLCGCIHSTSYWKCYGDVIPGQIVVVTFTGKSLKGLVQTGVMCMCAWILISRPMKLVWLVQSITGNIWSLNRPLLSYHAHNSVKTWIRHTASMNTCLSTPTASIPSYMMFSQPSLEYITNKDIRAWKGKIEITVKSREIFQVTNCTKCQQSQTHGHNSFIKLLWCCHWVKCNPMQDHSEMICTCKLDCNCINYERIMVV